MAQLFVGVHRAPPPGPLPDLISAFERLGLNDQTVLPDGPATHAFLVVLLEEKYPLRLEGEPPHAVINPWTPYLKDTDVAIWEIGCSTFFAEKMISHALKLIRTRYAYPVEELGRQAVALVGNAVGVDMQEVAMARLFPGAGICTRFVADVLEHGDDYAHGLVAGLPNLAPEALAQILKANQNTYRLQRVWRLW